MAAPTLKRLALENTQLWQTCQHREQELCQMQQREVKLCTLTIFLFVCFLIFFVLFPDGLFCLAPAAPDLSIAGWP